MTRVLIVDDDPQLRRFARATLEAARFEVADAADGEGLRAALLGPPIDVLILDLNLEHTTGIALLRDLRASETGPPLPVLFLSAQAEPSDRIEGLRAGADDYLAKPFAPEELQLRVAALAARRPRGAPRPAFTLEEIEAQLTGEGFATDVRLGRYRLLGRLGRGAIGVVFRAEDTLLHRAVALKSLRERAAAGAGSRLGGLVEQLLAEARTVALFQHPNIVAIYDVAGPEEPVPFIAMELVEGPTLGALLAGGRRLSAAETVALARGVAAGLAAAHEKGVVHGDVKPENVLLGLDGGIKVTDFGLAPVASRSTGDHGAIFGTPGYVAPEVLCGRGWTSAADLFSLGSLLFAALTGDSPFTGDTLPETIGRTITCEPDLAPLDELGAPEPLIRLITDLLIPEPAARPTSGRVRAELREVAAGLPRSWPPDGLRDRFAAASGAAGAHAEWIRTSSIPRP